MQHGQRPACVVVRQVQLANAETIPRLVLFKTSSILVQSQMMAHIPRVQDINMFDVLIVQAHGRKVSKTPALGNI
jgi:hypothetical protein